MAEGRGVAVSVGLGLVAAAVATTVAAALLTVADRELVGLLRARVRGGSGGGAA
jgi:hypothetical protein